MNDHKVIKSVSFNKRNPEEKLILEAVRRRNFSKYVKKLLLEDITKKQKNKQTTNTQPHTSQPEQIQNNTPSESKPLTISQQLSAMKRKG